MLLPPPPEWAVTSSHAQSHLKMKPTRRTRLKLRTFKHPPSSSNHAQSRPVTLNFFEGPPGGIRSNRNKVMTSKKSPLRSVFPSFAPSAFFRGESLKRASNFIQIIRPLRHLIIVQARFSLIAFLWSCCLTAIAGPAPHTQVRLVLAAETARPGDTVMAAVPMHMDKGWHTYWKNPGGSGQATSVDWELPPGVTAGPIQWPVPEKLPADDLTTYVYQNDVTLLVPLKLASDLKPGPLEIKAKVKWLECEIQCVPGDGDVKAALNIGSETKPSKDGDKFKAWEAKLPKKAEALQPRAWWEKAATDNTRPVILEWSSQTGVKEPDFYPDTSDQFEVQPIVEKLPADPGKVRLRAKVKKLLGDWPKEISGLLVECAQKEGECPAYDVTLPIGNSGPAIASAAQPQNENASTPLWRKLAYAFIGGLILNIMPCVLPVIALKILGFVSQAKDEPRQVRKLGLIYAFGVLVSFLGLAIIIMALKAAGSKAGLGFQFTNPYFVVGMTVLVALIALNLFGVFEVTLGSGALTAATGLASKHGSAGAFFNGLLATVLATSCSAPYLAAAVGFAFKETPAMIALIMLTVGLGLAAPYLILSWNPAWLKFLPKPGAWMEKFKIAMGFPMLAAAIWLCSIATLHYGDRTWYLAVFLVFVAVAAWVYGEFVQRGRKHRLLALVFTAAVLVSGYAYALERELQWRKPLSAIAQSDSPKAVSRVAPHGLDWQKWSPEAVAAAQAEGRPVLVDFTAVWCLTCNKIIKPRLESSAVSTKIKEVNAVPLVADYSLQPPDIGAELDRFGRRAVPLVVVFSKKPDIAPMVFDLPSESDLVAALDRAIQ